MRNKITKHTHTRRNRHDARLVVFEILARAPKSWTPAKKQETRKNNRGIHTRFSTRTDESLLYRSILEIPRSCFGMKIAKRKGNEMREKREKNERERERERCNRYNINRLLFPANTLAIYIYTYIPFARVVCYVARLDGNGKKFCILCRPRADSLCIMRRVVAGLRIKHCECAVIRYCMWTWPPLPGAIMRPIRRPPIPPANYYFRLTPATAITSKYCFDGTR